jgi:hypothetical protein
MDATLQLEGAKVRYEGDSDAAVVCAAISFHFWNFGSVLLHRLLLLDARPPRHVSPSPLSSSPHKYRSGTAPPSNSAFLSFSEQCVIHDKKRRKNCSGAVWR